MRIEAPVPEAVLAAIRAPFTDAGAAPIDPPVMQKLDLLLDIGGEAIRSRLFVFQTESGEELCLRAEFTVPVAHHHARSGAQAGRYRYEGKAFRDTPADGEAGHPQEFVQLGLEIFGGDDPLRDDAEIAALAWRSATAAGQQSLVMQLGDVALFRAFLSAIGAPKDVAARLGDAFGLDGRLNRELARASAPRRETSSDALASRLSAMSEKQAVESVLATWEAEGLSPIGGRSAEDVVRRLRSRRPGRDEPRLTPRQIEQITLYRAVDAPPELAFAAIGEISDAPVLAAAIDQWRRRIEAMTKGGVPVEAMSFAAGVGRGFNYYDGFLFRIAQSPAHWLAPIASGGRYDTLLTQLSGRPSAAVGCMVRPARAFAGTTS